MSQEKRNECNTCVPYTKYLSEKTRMAMNDHFVVSIFTILVPIVLIIFSNNDRNNHDGNGEVLIIPPKLELRADLSYGNTDITCPYSKMKWDTSATLGLFKGVLAWDLDNNQIERKASQAMQLKLGSQYTTAYWVNFRRINRKNGWRTLFRGNNDHWLIVQDDTLNLGFYSNRNGKFRTTGYSIKNDGKWKFILVTGCSSSTNTNNSNVSSNGVSKFYIGDAFDTPPTLVGLADRVASGTTFYRIGAGTSQGPGKVHSATYWNYMLNDKEIMAAWQNSKSSHLRAYPNIPIVIIAWNSYTFVKSFVDQLLKLLPTNDIIILDNNSTYPKLHKYYDAIERKLGDRIKIIRLQKNYGNEVYLTRKDLLPNVYILSDPDLQLNPSMPNNASNILFDISNKYEVFKVGLSLDITDSDKFESIPNYFLGKNIKEWESQFYEKKNKRYKYRVRIVQR